MWWVGLSFGLWNIVAETVLDEGVPAIVFGAYRAVGATPLLFMLALATEDVPRPSELTGREVMQLIALGFTNGIGDTGTFLVGLQLTTPDVAAITAPLAPLVCCILAVCLRLEIINLQKAFGVALGVGGSAVMLNFSSKGQQHAKNMTLGLLVLAGGLLCGSAAVLQQKPLYKRFGPATMTAYSFLASSGFFSLTSAIFYREWRDYNWAWGTQTNVVVVLYAICVCSFVNYATMCFSNRHLDATLIQMYAPVQTVVTVAIQWIRHGGSPRELLRDCGGMVLTAVGLWIVSKQQKKEDAAEEAQEDTRLLEQLAVHEPVPRSSKRLSSRGLTTAATSAPLL
jgi:drug/metabolite transporter (DMT)-like permease